MTLQRSRGRSAPAMLDRRTLIANLTLAGVGALLTACGTERDHSRSAPAAVTTLTPATPAGANAAAEATATPSLHPAPLEQRALYGQLLRRAGFGARPGELEDWLQFSWPEAVNRLVDYDDISNQALEDDLAGLQLDLTKPAGIQAWWLARMVGSARPLEEKLTLFWHGLLTSALSSAKAPLMLRQNQFLREHAMSDYGTLLKGITRDPAMMRWLNTLENKAEHANENYSRELMELFTLGPGHYSEADVRESARAFTGLSVRRNGEVYLNPTQHDDGVKTFLGQTGNFGPDDIIDIILQQPAAAPYLARRLLEVFATPTPTPETIQAIASVLTGAGFNIRETMRAILNLPELHDPANYRANVKTPAELLAGMLRQLGARVNNPIQVYVRSMPQMGQILFDPPNVAGWPGGPYWLNSGTWLARLNLANTVATNRNLVQFDPTNWFAGALPASPANFVQRVLELLLDGNLADEQRQILLDFAAEGVAADGGLSADWLDSHGRATLYLALALPEYHLV